MSERARVSSIYADGGLVRHIATIQHTIVYKERRKTFFKTKMNEHLRL